MVSRLKILRTNAGLSLRELAKKAGIDHTIISRMETQQGRIFRSKYDTLQAIASALGVSVEDIL